MVNARAKGAAGEREFAKWLHEYLSLEVMPERNLEQVRSGGADIVNVYPFIFEVKRVETLDLASWWIQCKAAWEEIRNFEGATDTNLIPVVAFRQNRQPWEFLVSAQLLKLELGFIRLNQATFQRFAIRQLKRYKSQGRTDMADMLDKFDKGFIKY
jgi:hypothetical protein